MTTGDLLRAIVVRWYVALVGVVLTVGAVMAIQAQSGTYESEVDVQFLPPRAFERTANNSPDNDLVAMAGLVEREVNRGAEPLRPASADVPLTGMGVKSGTLVTLPNEDGQFDFTFREPVLRVQAVGRSAEEVEELRRAQVREIAGTLDRIQADDGVPRDHRVTTRQVPNVPPVTLMPGSPNRAAAVVGVLGLALTGVACVQVDRLLLRNRRRARRSADSGHATTS